MLPKSVEVRDRNTGNMFVSFLPEQHMFALHNALRRFAGYSSVRGVGFDKSRDVQSSIAYEKRMAAFPAFEEYTPLFFTLREPLELDARALGHGLKVRQDDAFLPF